MGAPRLRPHNPQEYRRLLEWCRGAGSILEIGSRYGFTLYDIAHVMQPGARIASIDLPDQEGWNDQQAIMQLRANIALLKAEGYDAKMLEANSHSEGALLWARSLAPFDVVFIDGDHTYGGVEQDWREYGPMGSTVIFHDIRKPQPPEWMGLGVWKLWRKLKHGNTEQYLARHSKMGIGKVLRIERSVTRTAARA